MGETGDQHLSDDQHSNEQRNGQAQRLEQNGAEFRRQQVAKGPEGRFEHVHHVITPACQRKRPSLGRRAIPGE